MISSFCMGGGCVDVEFKKSSFSGPSLNCVEVGFTKSSFSGADCVEVAFVSGSGCPQCGGVNSKDCNLCRGR